ncbi:phosphoribosylformylglycinamidine synthase [Synechococcus sp. 60AY4M2]|jgi:phosphoribosylformylglycinamidine synthase|uniref:phosphoribosylformylglycinamidine synthase subunit PurQ n=1 Tax=unclassified Synechococcus TaxID=2626047 RepID=UPI000C17576F|nr:MULTISPECIES: phosphoribosylformylglycinamidine synthase subunit PurQ [unclassified Synechococcus]PIK94761.1 phosphoribosylformylglycinamidine synthase [Synechococcus sp. 60AY4M2]PIK97016.1 phosphoribosylformylglycinamidine synthase [Synechococcus sp. 63AY4M1]PIL02274.1 phosphoribosylformylglycinamidine synthase [Synechococcus sp. 65AY640]
MAKVRFGIVVFPGSNCDRDVAWVTRGLLGCPTRLIWHRETDLSGLDVVVLPGGFSYGDYLRAGALARFAPVMGSLAEHGARGGYVLGICNGFQILTEAGLLPGALVRNANLHFICDRVGIRVERQDLPWTSAYPCGATLTLPIAHGEGRYVCDADTLKQLQDRGQIVFRYAPVAPNGSVDNIAGICDPSGRILGLMPHPERAADPDLPGQDGIPFWQSIVQSLSS